MLRIECILPQDRCHKHNKKMGGKQNKKQRDVIKMLGGASIGGAGGKGGAQHGPADKQDGKETYVP